VAAPVDGACAGWRVRHGGWCAVTAGQLGLNLPADAGTVAALVDGRGVSASAAPLAAVPDITIVVYGQPAPQGSKMARPIYRGKGENRVFTGKVAQVESSKTGVADWRADVKRAAEDAIGDWRGSMFPLDGALLLTVVFSLPRPKSHYRTGRNAHLLRDGAPARPAGMPDLSKLLRSTEDALKTAGVYVDDARIVEYRRLAKVYVGEDRDALTAPGAVIRIWSIEAGDKE
jgi:Holliday junction resolvase RusA-like endonuclease